MSHTKPIKQTHSQEYPHIPPSPLRPHFLQSILRSTGTLPDHRNSTQAFLGVLDSSGRALLAMNATRRCASVARTPLLAQGTQIDARMSVHTLDSFDHESVDLELHGNNVFFLPKRASKSVPALLNSSCRVPPLGYDLELSTRFTFNGWGPSSFSSDSSFIRDKTRWLLQTYRIENHGLLLPLASWWAPARLSGMRHY